MRFFLKMTAILFLTSICQAAIAQPKIKGLTVGNQVPDLEIKKIINYNTAVKSLADFKGKALILDFWAPWCAPCISAFPKMDSLQQEFASVLNILPVTQSAEDYSANTLNSLKENKGIKMTYSVVGDRVISRAFTHRFIPHYVWINAEGIVVAITGSNEVTKKNVKALIDNQPLKLPLKVDKVMRDFGYNPILADNDLITRENLAFRSQVLRYTENLDDVATQVDGLIRCGNHPISLLYMLAFGKFDLGFLNHNRIVLKNFSPADSLMIGFFKDGASKAAYLNNKQEYKYTYELTFPKSMFSVDEKFEIMQQDLNRFFFKKSGISGKLEQGPVKVYSLVKTGNADKFKSSTSQFVFEANRYAIKARNTPMATVLKKIQLSSPFSKHIHIIDDTGYKGNIDIDISGDVIDPKVLNSNFEKYGLKLVEKSLVMPVIVLTKSE
ncbi:redoxin domain-containing protein [Pedobacter ginsengisoli]|uniref:redoxin domain-containing protein n=1 Tax=Pedobacter ginsengisoli TaxID=363852 RepID=UPI00254F47CB|nr:redoxin domain-containing protein [Pedobacter ginsengisoli]